MLRRSHFDSWTRMQERIYSLWDALLFTDFNFLALLSNVSVLCLDPKMSDERKNIQQVPVFIWHSRMNTCCVDKSNVLQVFTSHSERSVFFIIYVSLCRLQARLSSVMQRLGRGPLFTKEHLFLFILHDYLYCQAPAEGCFTHLTQCVLCSWLTLLLPRLGKLGGGTNKSNHQQWWWGRGQLLKGSL